MKSRNDTTIFERRAVSKGQILIKEGEYGQQAYLIQSGEVKVYVTQDDREIEIARLQAGEIVGEMAFIFDGPRTASVKAATDANLIVISRQQFQEKLKESDPTIRAIVLMLSKRIVDANNSLLNKKSDLQDLKDTARIIYENIAFKVPKNQQRTLENTVLPQLEALFDALSTFEDRYSDDPS